MHSNFNLADIDHPDIVSQNKEGVPEIQITATFNKP